MCECVCVCVRRNPLFSEIFLPFLVSHLISLVFFPSFNEDDEEDEKKIGKPSADEGEEETCHAPFFRGWKNETGGALSLVPSFSIFQKSKREKNQAEKVKRNCQKLWPSKGKG